MPKLRNISDFRQTVIINGTKKLMRPGDVIESPTELRYVFLEPVSNDTPVTVGSSSTTFNRLKTELEQLKQDKDSLAAVKTEQVEENLGAIQAAMNDLRKDVSEQIEGLRSSFTDEFRTIGENMTALKSIFDANKSKLDSIDKDYADKFDKSFRRLEMLKSAMMTLEDAVYGDDEGN
jgi:uncharacterized phage infection (PIP) family protein YhgE